MAKLIGRKVDDSSISQKILLLQKVLTSKKNLVRVYCITLGKEVQYYTLKIPATAFIFL